MPAVNYKQDSRVVMTMDVGETAFHFSAWRGGKQVSETMAMSFRGNDLNYCLFRIVEGFLRVEKNCVAPPVAISFAFPGPADYPNGIIHNLLNIPCFRGGVALGPMLEEKFRIPVFINNDGDLFAYGEAIAGFLPYVNGLLEKSGSSKRYKNLLGVTLGIGFGAGIVHEGKLFSGDNSMAAEIWLMRNKIYPAMNAEEGASVRAVRQTYAKIMNILPEATPDSITIGQIAMGGLPDKRAAAIEAYRRLGEVAGDAIGNALTLVDGLAVIGGHISKGHHLFLPAVVDQLNSTYTSSADNLLRRLTPVAFNLEDDAQKALFLKGESREIRVPGSFRKIKYDSLHRVGVGVSRLGTSKAIAIGAYVFALNKLEEKTNLASNYMFDKPIEMVRVNDK
jgi:glucokinase